MRTFISSALVSINTDQTLTTRLHLIFKSDFNLPKCLDLSFSKLSCSLLPPPPLFHPPPSSSHGVIQRKISAVNLFAYGFSTLTTLWTPPPRFWLSGEADAQWLRCQLHCRLVGIICCVCSCCNSDRQCTQWNHQLSQPVLMLPSAGFPKLVSWGPPK